LNKLVFNVITLFHI